MKPIFLVNILFLLFTLNACEDPQANNKTGLQKPAKTMGHSDKRTAPIEMKHTFAGKPVTGVPISIALSIMPGVSADNMHVLYTTTPELVAGDNVTEFQFNNVTAHNPVDMNINVIPQTDAMHYVYLQVTLENSTALVGSRSFAIAITTGNKSQKPKLPAENKVNETPAGERLIIKKAKETRE